MQSSPLPAATGPVVSTGSGLRLWATIDAEAGTAAEVPGTRNMQEVMRLSDGSLAGLTFDTSSRTWTYARSVDGGEHWETRTLDVGDNALCSLVETDGTVDAVVEGADGATVFPFIAVHRAAPGEDAFAKIPGPPDPRAYLSGQLVLPDGRLLLGIENWQAVPAR